MFERWEAYLHVCVPEGTIQQEKWAVWERGDAGWSCARSGRRGCLAGCL